MLTLKKIRVFRVLILLIVIILLLGITYSANLLNSLKYKSHMNAVETGIIADLAIPAGDAADASRFSEQNPVGAGYRKVAENNNLILFLEDNLQGIKLYDKQSGQIWSSLMQGEGLSAADLSESYYNAMNSMLTFQYVDLHRNGTKEELTYSSVEPCEGSYEAILNGVRVTYNFYELNIHLSVDFTLEDNRLSVSVPDELIEENISGDDELEKNRKQLKLLIKKLETGGDDVKKATSMSDYSESKHRIIELTINSNREILLSLENHALSGNLSPNALDDLNDNIKRLLSLTDDNKTAQELLSEIRPTIDELEIISQKLSDSRSTGITSLQVIPYFGAQRSSTDGYVFFPDRNGAISYFNRKHSVMAGVYQQDIYSEHAILQLINTESVNIETNYTSPTMMPVFGIKAEKSAFVGIIDKGDTDSAILFNPCQPDIDAGNINPLYYVRKKSTYVSENSNQNIIFDRLRTKTDWRTYYVFLNGEAADYSGMAVEYRKYLEEKELLVPSKMMGKDLPIGLRYFMGIESNRQSLLREYITMTRFSDIIDHLNFFKNAGVENVMINISDWSEHNGVREPDTLKPAGEIGGIKGLTQLSEFAKNNNYLLSFSKQMVWANRKDMSSEFIDTAAVRNKSLLTFASYGWHLLNPLYIYNSNVSDSLITFKKYGINGLEIGAAGNLLYFDYNSSGSVDRSDTARVFNKLAREIQKTLGYSVGTQANSYMFSALDWNMYVSLEDSKFLYADENVPFYQMVIHGSIPYTGEEFNLMHDETLQKLQAIEYGYLPYFFITEEPPFKMREAGYNYFLSGHAGTLLNNISEIYQDYKEDFGAIWNKKIIRHNRLSDTISKTEYDGGYSVYVNYGDTEASIDNITIGAKDYTVVRT